MGKHIKVLCRTCQLVAKRFLVDLLPSSRRLRVFCRNTLKTAILIAAAIALFVFGRVYETGSYSTIDSIGHFEGHSESQPRSRAVHLKIAEESLRRNTQDGEVNDEIDIGDLSTDELNEMNVGLSPRLVSRKTSFKKVKSDKTRALPDEKNVGLSPQLVSIRKTSLNKVKSDKTRALPDDFWNGSQVDDIVIDTTRPIVNPHRFRRTLNSPTLCGDEKSQGDGVFLVCYVHTAVDHFKRRARIRKTWARQANYANTTIRTLFVTGRTDNAQWLQSALEHESRKYGDIVQEDFLDTYRNLSYKGVAALRWVATYCSRAKYVMKTDDDMFVNMFALIKHLRDLHSAGYRRRLLMCYVWWRMHVLREGKWAIPRENMPDDLYPVYCSGMGYVLTTDVAVAMYRASYYERFFWVDDVYISGCLPRALQGAVNHTDMSKAYCASNEMSVYYHATEWYKHVFSHVHNEDMYVKTWKKLVEMARNNTIPTPSVIQPGVLAKNYIPKHRLFPSENKKKSFKKRPVSAIKKVMKQLL